MDRLFFEEFLGRCEVESVSTGGRCGTQKELVRRTMSPEYGIIGIPRCQRCMPEFFSNPKDYKVVKALKSKAFDPIYDDYIEYYNRKFLL